MPSAECQRSVSVFVSKLIPSLQSLKTLMEYEVGDVSDPKEDEKRRVVN